MDAPRGLFPIEISIFRANFFQVYKSVSQDLHRFGDRVVVEVEALGRDADIEHPRLEQVEFVSLISRV